jgi:XTP/dITP diphosphohydrolase
VNEELLELQAELAAPEVATDKAEDEFGDVLFSLVNWARWHHLNPEDALERTNRKFRTRVEYMEAQAQQAGKSLREYSLNELEVLWQAAKHH